MYSDMTREELIAQLQAADRQIQDLQAEIRSLEIDLADAEEERDDWEDRYINLENKAYAADRAAARAEERRLHEWNDWAQKAVAAAQGA